MPRIALSLLLLVAGAFAGEARWIRYPAISPDGRWVVFSYAGDLWRVAAAGGVATPVTTHVGYERSPVWSPDGRRIAFASDRHGNFDVFVVPTEGGAATRLTFHSSHDTPSAFSPDGSRVLFSSSRLDAPKACIGSAWISELYAVPVGGGRPTQMLTTPALHARYAGKQIVYEDFKGWENPWRKHHTSAVTRDIWLYDPASGKHTRLTKHRAEDREPVWTKGGVHFLSERGGSFNVYRMGEPPVAVTRHGPHPCRFLSAANDGTLCYAYNGDLWIRPPDGEPRRVRVQVNAGAKVNAIEAKTLRKGATQLAVSPNEDEVAFVVRGEVFCTSTKHGTTKRITATPGQERSVAWAPDGKSLYYAAERDGSWNLYRTSLARKDEERFFLSTTLKEEPVLVSREDTFQPVVSPDGKRIAYLENRDALCVLDLASKRTRTLIPAKLNYSYSDGDTRYAWSPDSRFLVTTYVPRGRWIDDVAVVEVATGKTTDVSPSGYFEREPRWSPRGDAILFVSNRLGRRSHGSWGSDADIFAIYLTQAAYDRARLSEEDYELLRKAEKEKDKDEDKDKDEKKGKKKKKKKVEPVEIESRGLEKRTRRLTVHSAPMGAYAMAPDGESIAYLARVGEKWNLWLHKIRKAETKRLAKIDGDDEDGDVFFSEEGDAVFLRTSEGAIKRIEIKGEAKGVGYAAPMTIDHPRERRYILEHVWRQTRAKFYDANLHGVDWNAMRENYEAFLGHIVHNHDFAELLSEMVGELNASHTGTRYRIPQEGADQTAALGLLYDVAHRGAGLRVAEVIEDGPVDRAGEAVPPGSLLVKIDGVTLAPAVNHNALLNRKEGRRVLLTFLTPGNKTVERVVRPVDQRAERNLRYRRWIKQRRLLTDKLSNGKLGYVHVRAMNDRSFRHVFQEVLGRHRDKRALIVDTRYNGGGWLHDDLVVFLGGKPYLTLVPRGKEKGAFGGEPMFRWSRPVVVLQNEGNYSDGHVFPYAFKQLGIGKLIGSAVAGTGTAVWWERQIDRSLAYGIPQIGTLTPGGKYLENLELEPDIEVHNDPESTAKGRDLQLEKAVETLLR